MTTTSISGITSQVLLERVYDSFKGREGSLEVPLKEARVCVEMDDDPCKGVRSTYLLYTQGIVFSLRNELFALALGDQSKLQVLPYQFSLVTFKPSPEAFHIYYQKSKEELSTLLTKNIDESTPLNRLILSRLTHRDSFEYWVSFMQLDREPGVKFQKILASKRELFVEKASPHHPSRQKEIQHAIYTPEAVGLVIESIEEILQEL